MHAAWHGKNFPHFQCIFITCLPKYLTGMSIQWGPISNIYTNKLCFYDPVKIDYRSIAYCLSFSFKTSENGMKIQTPCWSVIVTGENRLYFDTLGHDVLGVFFFLLASVALCFIHLHQHLFVQIMLQKIVNYRLGLEITAGTQLMSQIY